jgi:hypothetical protein
MTEIEMKVKLLGHIDKIAKAWANGDVESSRREYEYVIGFCDGAGLDFSNVLMGGVQHLLIQAVSIVDVCVYNGYLNGEEAGFLARVVATI